MKRRPPIAPRNAATEAFFGWKGGSATGFARAFLPISRNEERTSWHCHGRTRDLHCRSSAYRAWRAPRIPDGVHEWPGLHRLHKSPAGIDPAERRHRDGRPARKPAAATCRQRGPWLLFLPPCPPDPNSIEMAFFKTRGGREATDPPGTANAPWKTTGGKVLDRFPDHDRRNLFAASGYRTDRSENAQTFPEDPRSGFPGTANPGPPGVLQRFRNGLSALARRSRYPASRSLRVRRSGAIPPACRESTRYPEVDHSRSPAHVGSGSAS